jgi:alpha-amylase
MYEIRNVFNQEKSAFADVDALGVFIDNHDNARFLSMSPSMPLFKTALTFTLFSQGIPIIYYGSEQGFNGGNDPYNRELLWPSMNSEAPLYKFLQGLISIRKS